MWVAALVLKRKKWWWLPGKITGNHFSEVLCHHWDVIIIVIWDLKASSTLSKGLHFKVKRNFSLLISPSNLTFWRQKSKVFWYPKNIHSRDNIAFRSSRSAIKNSIDLLFTISFRESCFLWTIVLQSWLMQVAPKKRAKTNMYRGATSKTIHVYCCTDAGLPKDRDEYRWSTFTGFPRIYFPDYNIGRDKHYYSSGIINPRHDLLINS